MTRMTPPAADPKQTLDEIALAASRKDGAVERARELRAARGAEASYLLSVRER